MTPKLRNLRCVLLACPVKERSGHSSLPMLLRTLAIRTTHSRVLPATMRHAKAAHLITITSGHLARKVSPYPTDVSRAAHLCTKSGSQKSVHKESAQKATDDKEDKKQSEDHPKDEEQEPPLEVRQAGSPCFAWRRRAKGHNNSAYAPCVLCSRSAGHA